MNPSYAIEIKFSIDDVLKMLRNVGIDTNCGACCEIAFTGVTTNSHTCK